MFKFGLKLWSINDNYVDEAVSLYEQDIYHYIELYAVPDTYDTYVSLWKSLSMPFIIHAPHFKGGLNLAKKGSRANNMTLISETRKFADTLKADKIIVHPGIAGDISETVDRLKEINDPRILIENKPYYALFGGLICNGATIEEIKFVLGNTNIGLCLDIGHAFCSANAQGIEPTEYLKEFLKLSPGVYHLSDGDYKDIFDKHDHFGRGNYNIQKIISLIPQHSHITVETGKDFRNNLSDFICDIKFLKNLGILKKNENMLSLE
jgi:deoxyribonuclease IV